MGDAAKKCAAPVLVVDDSPSALMLIQKILSQLNCSVLTAASGQQAVDACNANSLACVLMDVEMPDMSGFEVAAKLRQSRATRNIPIIFITGTAEDQACIFEGYELGAVDYLFKPLEEHVLFSKVGVFIDLYCEKHGQLKALVEKLKAAKRKLQEKNRQLRILARHDSLTSLPNRLQFKEDVRKCISHSKRSNQEFTLLFIDLDYFKTINDTMGHDVGDTLLKKVARLLLSLLRVEDCVARLGGDEFAILLFGIETYHQAAVVSNKILKALNAPFRIKGNDLQVSASIGIACYPRAGTSLKALLKSADTAMYHCKKKGGGCFSYYSQELNDAYKRRSEIERQLHFAIKNDELFLVYQPMFDIEKKRLVGMEALIRWRHPEMGVLLPGEFIPIAEEIGLASRLGEWVLVNACACFSGWYDAGHKSVRFSTNVSACQLQQKSLFDIVVGLHENTGIPTDQMIFEITEAALLLQEDHAAKLLHELSRFGFQISIDDFGTGYSSLARLQDLPIQILKIDRSFVAGIGGGGDEVVRSIIDLAKNLDLKVIAEGVETAKQEKFLLDNNCSVGQGYYYSKPVSQDQMSALLEGEIL